MQRAARSLLPLAFTLAPDLPAHKKAQPELLQYEKQNVQQAKDDTTKRAPLIFFIFYISKISFKAKMRVEDGNMHLPPKMHCTMINPKHYCYARYLFYKIIFN